MGKFSKLIYLLGAYQIGSPLYAFGFHQYNYIKREEIAGTSNENRLKKEYGGRIGDKPAWALVTGGSEGIGKEFVLNLAKSGFNIAICSRSISKLDDAKKEVEAKYPNIEVRSYPLDFSKTIDYSSITNDEDLKNNV